MSTYLGGKIHIPSICGMLMGATLLYGNHRQLSIRVTKEILTGKDPGIATFGASLERLYQPMLKRALADSIPILGLSNLFNPQNPELYESEIEPSFKGGKFIADELSKIIQNYDNRSSTMRASFRNWKVITP